MSSIIRKEMQLQGPRPAPLRIGSCSSKIKKPSGQRESRFPVIIHLISPKVIHVPPEEFMTLVQRLTGKDDSPPDQSAQSFRPSMPPGNCCGQIRAAAAAAASASMDVAADEIKGCDDDANYFGLSPTWIQFLTCS